MEKRNLKNLRCGECGLKAFEHVDVKGKFAIPWRDYPRAYLTKSLILPVCQNCENYAHSGEESALIDEAIEASIKDQTKQFIEVIKEKADITSLKLASTIGLSPEFISMLLNQKKVPSFQLWNELRVIAKDPVNRIAEMNPELDVRTENLLLRA